MQRRFSPFSAQETQTHVGERIAHVSLRPNVRVHELG